MILDTFLQAYIVRGSRDVPRYQPLYKAVRTPIAKASLGNMNTDNAN